MFNHLKYAGIYSYPLNWLAIYKDGTHLKEFTDTGIKNDFHSINQDEVEYFGLYGKGNAIYFDSNGKFYYNGKEIHVTYETEKGNFELTNNPTVKDLITYKKAFVEYDRLAGTKENVSDGIAVGYKYKLSVDDFELHVQLVINMPLAVRERPSLEIKLTPNQSVEQGKLLISNEKRLVDTIEAPVLQGYAGQINWNIEV